MPHKSKHKQQFRKKQVAPSVKQVNDSTTSVTMATNIAVKAPVAKPKTGTNAQALIAVGPARYPFLAAEVKWIGVSAGIIVIIMILLKVILPLFNI